MRVIVQDNFFPDLPRIVDQLKNREHFSGDCHPEDPRGNWPGKRSLNYALADPILTALVMTLGEGIFPVIQDMALHTHWRMASDNVKDWVHVDTNQCTVLIYLSDTNMNSGTQFFDNHPDQGGKVILETPFVQNRLVCFYGNPWHCSKQNYGNDESDGRFTMNIFINHDGTPING